MFWRFQVWVEAFFRIHGSMGLTVTNSLSFFFHEYCLYFVFIIDGYFCWISNSGSTSFPFLTLEMLCHSSDIHSFWWEAKCQLNTVWITVPCIQWITVELLFLYTMCYVSLADFQIYFLYLASDFWLLSLTLMCNDPCWCS